MFGTKAPPYRGAGHAGGDVSEFDPTFMMYELPSAHDSFELLVVLQPLTEMSED